MNGAKVVFMVSTHRFFALGVLCFALTSATTITWAPQGTARLYGIPFLVLACMSGLLFRPFMLGWADGEPSLGYVKGLRTHWVSGSRLESAEYRYRGQFSGRACLRLTTKEGTEIWVPGAWGAGLLLRRRNERNRVALTLAGRVVIGRPRRVLNLVEHHLGLCVDSSNQPSS